MVLAKMDLYKYHNVYMYFSSGYIYPDLIIMDFAKAFDKVPHRRLCTN